VNDFQAEPPAPATVVQPERIPTEPASAPSRRGGSGALLNVALGLALAVAVGGIAFAAGRATAPAPAFTNGNGVIGRGPLGSFDPGANPGANPDGFGGGGLGAGNVTLSGTVEAIGTNSLTIRTASGQTLEIALDEATTYHAQSDAAAGDVVTGEAVLVRIDIAAGRAGGASGATASDVTVVP
jgi:hypothetical protein